MLKIQTAKLTSLNFYGNYDNMKTAETRNNLFSMHVVEKVLAKVQLNCLDTEALTVGSTTQL